MVTPIRNIIEFVFDVSICAASVFVTVYVYACLHTAWYGYVGCGWQCMTIERSDYGLIRSLYFNGCYVLTGVMVGLLTGGGAVEAHRRMIRLIFGPGLMWGFWLFYYTNDPVTASLVFPPVALASFGCSSSVWARVYRRLRHEKAEVAKV